KSDEYKDELDKTTNEMLQTGLRAKMKSEQDNAAKYDAKVAEMLEVVNELQKLYRTIIQGE
ncbi:MAG: hypothetical protein ACRC2T_02270, partial [Thermoguttaceae bacterium]